MNLEAKERNLFSGNPKLIGNQGIINVSCNCKCDGIENRIESTDKACFEITIKIFKKGITLAFTFQAFVRINFPK